ncbi:hypothetical protein EDB92DRAFT_2113476 [Lactarius akahatsu]|uniref:Uncharacterized protein n=1 Tax=Lactarius akahatsu TaxID=416441 RepID=A0AAD4QF61_9AGAM|nr:hypothetical protein EDB92DRAFT_2113476 [Lactarius akahatsu]
MQRGTRFLAKRARTRVGEDSCPWPTRRCNIKRPLLERNQRHNHWLLGSHRPLLGSPLPLLPNSRPISFRSASTSCTPSVIVSFLALASRLFHIFDVRKMDTPEQTRESSLKFLTRALACMADGQGYATASVEGRIAVEYFDPSPGIQEKKYAFKCHRQTIDDVDHVWPVKKRLRQYPRYTSPVAALAFSADGTRLAVGASYTWDEGEEGARSAERPALFVREPGEEVKPKDGVPDGTVASTSVSTDLPALLMDSLLSCTSRPCLSTTSGLRE